MVVSINANQSQIAMLSLPRDTVDVPLGDGRIYHGKINAIMNTFGLATLKNAVSALLDVPIDGYVKIDMDDLVTLVDAVGGVDVDVTTWVVDARLKLNIPPGPIHLDGPTALSFTRTRADSDYGRAARQQQVVLALVRAYADPATVWSLPDLLGSMRALDTDLDLARLPSYLAVARRSTGATVVATVLQPPRFSRFVGIEPGTSRGWVMIPNVPEMQAYAHQLISD
jgi:LCP family protein required for cell wall assembly